jgi:NADPH2:quinone reductase
LRAIVCREYGPPESLVMSEVPEPVPGPGEVVITVKAASVNFPDVLIIQNRYQVKPPLPFSPGSEAAGIVKAVGPGVTHVRPGDAVVAITLFGAFAEQVKTEGRRVLPIPPGMDFVTASAFLLTYGTADHALRDRGSLKPGETLLVLGAAGGTGIAAIEVGKALGARVIACASTGAKLAVCLEHGADATINYEREHFRERVRALTAGAGADVVFDPVGGSYSEPALRSSAWRGRFLVVGFAAGEIPRIPLNLPLLKGCSIVGVFWGDFVRRDPHGFAESVAQLGRWYEEGRLRIPVAATFPLAEAPRALALMARRQLAGKAVITVGHEGGEGSKV